MLARIRDFASPRLLAALAFGVSLSLASLGSATTAPTFVTWDDGEGANGHTYSYVPLSCTVICVTWTDADKQAKAKLLPDGTPGYLASITSKAEQDFIESLVLPPVGSDRNQVWIGGQQDPHNAPDQGWGWRSEVTPEEWRYTNWTIYSPAVDGSPEVREPSDDGNIDERFLTLWAHYYLKGADGLFTGDDLRGHWNDEKDKANPAARIIGMICEWNTAGVPEPGTAALAALGLGVLALVRRLSC